MIREFIQREQHQALLGDVTRGVPQGVCTKGCDQASRSASFCSVFEETTPAKLADRNGDSNISTTLESRASSENNDEMAFGWDVTHCAERSVPCIGMSGS